MTVKNLSNLNCSDQDLLNHIRLNTRKGEYQAYLCLKNNCSNKFRGVLRRFGVREEYDMNDIESESMADLFFNILTGKFKGESGVCTYFISIGINKWRKLLRDRQTKIPKSINNPEDVSFAANFEAYLNNDLEEKEQQEMKQLIANDTDLQEMLEIFRPSIPSAVELEHISIPYQEVEKIDAEEMKNLIKRKFPPDSNCVDTLIDYYFQYEASYIKMAHAIKRRVEKVETVYERIKKQINRCLDKIKK